MDFGEFVDVFGNVVERCFLIVVVVWFQRSFFDLEDLEKYFFAFIDVFLQLGKVVVLDIEIFYRGVLNMFIKIFLDILDYLFIFDIFIQLFLW